MNIKSEKLPYLPYLDGWRGIAIIMVLIAHFNSAGGKHNLGPFGVSVFFVLSGFLMSRILFTQKTPLSTFYRRRFARIFPVLWLYLIIVFFGGWLFLNEFHMMEFISNALFLRTYFPAEISIAKSYVPIGHIWSLNVEEHSYILLSIFSLIATRFGEFSARIALTVCSMLCVTFFVFYKNYPPDAQTVFIWRTEVAAFPLLLSCVIYLWLKKQPIRIAGTVPILTFIAALGIAIFSNSVFLSYIGISIFLAVSVNTLDMAPVSILAILSNPVLRWFGVCSYSIYLWQEVFYFAGRYTNNFNYYNVFAFVMTLLVASCSYYFFEKPVRNLLSGKS